MSYKYQLIIYWSNEDNIFIADVPQLKSCTAHGNTQVEALHSVEQAIELWIETAKEFNQPIPKPKGERLLFA